MVSDEEPGDTGGLAEVVFGFGAGSRIAGYRLEEQVGRGGMAVVFRAQDERLGRLVALKILAPALADDDAFRQRFVRESRAAAAVDDPHIVPVFAAGEVSVRQHRTSQHGTGQHGTGEHQGVLFIAMRYVAGGDVRALMRREGRLSPARAAAIISPVGSALDAAHAAGLVHRDVKPANILVDVQFGRPDHVYLADFGLSKAAFATSGLTGAGQFLGTADYISPEQIEDRPVDGRTDEYALACTAFELLAGAPPFRRGEAMAVMYAQLSEPPPLLTSRRPGLPPAADQVFARALAKAPEDRYASCREFADALRMAFGLVAYDSGSGAIPAVAHSPTQISGPLAGAAIAAAAAAPGGGTPTTAVDFPASLATATSLEHPGPGDGDGDGDGTGAGDGDGTGPARRRHRLSPLALTGIGALAVAGIAAAALATLPSHGATSFSKHTSSPTPAATRPTVVPSKAPTATATATVVAPVVATPVTVPSVTAKPTATSSPTPTPTTSSSPTPTASASSSPTATASATAPATTGTSGG